MTTLDWEEQDLLDSPIDTFAPKKRPRGRPAVLSAAELLGRRNDFVYLLENHWGDVGLALRKAKTIADIRSALSIIQKSGHNGSDLEPFLRVSTVTETDAAALRALRKELRALSREQRLAYMAETECGESVGVAKQAVQESPGGDGKAYLEQLLAARETTLCQAKEKSASLLQQYYALRDTLEDHDACFAQDQLLRCILDRRYSFTPVNLASAMAGLPEIGWRRSAKIMARCSSPAPVYVAYDVFLIIDTAVKRSVSEKVKKELSRKVAKKEETRLLDWLRYGVTGGDRKTANASSELKQNWQYLRRAVEEVEKQNRPSTELPFLVTAEYQRRWQHASAADRILAHEERLV